METKIELATSFRKRLKGLLRTTPHENLIVLVPCKSVHTWGMKYMLDIAFLDKKGIVLAAYRAVPPNKRLSCRKSYMVLERFSISQNWLVKGDELAFIASSTNDKEWSDPQ